LIEDRRCPVGYYADEGLTGLDAAELLDGQPLAPREYDDRAVRQLIDTIRVMPDGRITIIFKGGDTVETQYMG
jgi:hypothetical protein